MRASRLGLRAAVAILTSLGIASCSSVTEPAGAPTELRSLPRELTSTEQHLVDASNDFSFALWSKVNTAETGSNVFISPLSASFALGMTLDGAANSTFDQIRSALQLDGLSQAEINSGYRSLIALLTSLDPGVTMRIANSIWYRQTLRVNQSFVDDVRAYFDADAQGLNFSDVNGSLATINGWVNQKTNGKIPSILDDITSDNVMFLINALYFDGSWREQFDRAKTTDDVFTIAPGMTQPMRLMHRQGELSYTETPTYQAVDLPYGNTAFTMTVLLPKADVDVETVAAALTSVSWRSLTASFDATEVDLALPKFQMSFKRTMNDDLSALGMADAFIAGHADFTRMSPDGLGLYLSFVTQKTFVDVDERGTKAAAVTAVGVSVTSFPAYRVMRVDHPFVFVIRERLSGTVLFMGKVVRIAS